MAISQRVGVGWKGGIGCNSISLALDILTSGRQAVVSGTLLSAREPNAGQRPKCHS